jgi:hypothetical protein
MALWGIRFIKPTITSALDIHLTESTFTSTLGIHFT